MKILMALVVLGLGSTLLMAGEPKPIRLETIRDPVKLLPGEEWTVRFERDGDRLVRPVKKKGTDPQKGTVAIKVELTTASPVPPPRPGATRPYLQVENQFDRTLHFRVFVRLKGSKDFVELARRVEPLETGDTFTYCWDFDTQIDEIVVGDFTLSEAKGK